MDLDAISTAGFDYFLDHNKYQKRKKEIFELLNKLFGTHRTKLDTVIGVDRKGDWILKNFFSENPGLRKINIISDNEIESRSSMIKGLRILIFDDSIHTSNTMEKVIERIKPYQPSDITLACLISNKDAVDRIQIKYPGTRVITCKACYDDYSTQAVQYLEWELPFVNGLKSKDNPDFPLLKITTPNSDLDLIAESIIMAVGATVSQSNIIETEIEPVHNSINALNINIELEPSITISSPYDQVAESEESKIRVFITCYEDKTDIVITPLILTRNNSSTCSIFSKSPEDCLCKLLNLKRRKEMVCKFCLPIFVNSKFLIKIQQPIISTLQTNKIYAESVKIESPKIGRFI